MADADSDDQEISLSGEKNITRDALRRKRKGKVIFDDTTTLKVYTVLACFKGKWHFG